MHQIVITQLAISDIEKARNWYEKKLPGLGFKFADHAFKCLHTIQLHPLSNPGKYKYTRELYMRKFPYLIIYSIEENFVFILRIFSCKVDPKKKYRIPKTKFLR